MMRLSAWLAIAFGASVAVAQLVRNWGNWGAWPTWTIDEFSSAVLILAGVLTLRGTTGRFLAPGWAFACGLFGSSLIGYWRGLALFEGEAYAGHLRFLAIVAALLSVCIVGLALSLAERRKAL
jgi:hypothetical protein